MLPIRHQGKRCGELGTITVMDCPQLAVLLAGSFAVQMMIVIPTGYGAFNAFPSLRVPETVTLPESSEAAGVPGFTVAVN